MDTYYIDSETCGFVGPMVLFQYAKNDGPVVLHEVWQRPARDTLAVIEEIANNGVVGFNLVFDWFHVQKIQNIFSLLPARRLNEPPRVQDVLALERKAPLVGKCVKPRAPLDMYLNLIIGPFQSLMERRPIRIKKVPIQVAEELITELEHALQFDWIYTKRKKEGPAWKVKPSKDASGFVDLSFSFGASRTLKSLHKYVFNSEPIIFPMPEEMMPEEIQWCPYSDGRPGTWPDVIEKHIEYWATNKEARQYGKDDVTMVRDLRKKYPFPLGDMESTLACMVASVRYRGFPIDINGVNREYTKSKGLSEQVGNLDWRPVLAKLHELCTDPMERSIITSTKDEALEPLLKWVGESGEPGSHPVAKYAAKVREARKHRFRAGWLGKLLETGRFHPSFSPVGTLTRRKSGSGGLNPQNIDKEPESRSLFILVDDAKTLKEYETFLGYKLGVKPEAGWKGCAGDFDSFETVLAIAAWQDELLTKYVNMGVKPYHVFGSYLYRRVLGGPKADPKVALVEIRKKENKVQYADRAKNCWYALIYGAQEYKISQTAGVPIEHVAEALKMMSDECVGMARGRQGVFDKLSCIVQESEGRPFEWNDPDPIIPNIQGWERDFSFEVGIIKSLFDLTNRLPKSWREFPEKVFRSQREQTVLGATYSAMFGACKGMEARMKRQAGNCIMQSSGAMYCKDLEFNCWGTQPYGIHPWQVVLMNVHDEEDGASKKSLKPIVDKCLKRYAVKVPLVQMEWKEGIRTWAEK